MDSKRISLFMGHYGSGKSFSAVNYAYMLKAQNKKVSVYDLDIVNPYFRTIDAERELKTRGIDLVVSKFAETNVDVPALNPASYRMIADKNQYAVIDVGGDDRGALALGRFAEDIKKENDYDAFWVINCFRPETRTIEDALLIKKEIEYASKIPFTAIVNNSNLGQLTALEDIVKGYEFCQELEKQTGLPIKFTSVREDLITNEIKQDIGEILSVKPIEYKIW